MRYLIWTLALVASIVNCGEGAGPNIKEDGRIYVENSWREDHPDYGPWIRARLEKVDEQLIEGELKPIPYGKGPIEITIQPVPGGATAVVHIRTVRWRTLDWHLPFVIDGSIVIRITGMVPDAHDLRYEVRSYGR